MIVVGTLGTGVGGAVGVVVDRAIAQNAQDKTDGTKRLHKKSGG
jgi:hypothetical protein